MSEWEGERQVKGRGGWMEVGRKGGSPEVGEVGRERGSRGEVV